MLAACGVIVMSQKRAVVGRWMRYRDVTKTCELLDEWFRDVTKTEKTTNLNEFWMILTLWEQLWDHKNRSLKKIKIFLMLWHHNSWQAAWNQWQFLWHHEIGLRTPMTWHSNDVHQWHHQWRYSERHRDITKTFPPKSNDTNDRSKCECFRDITKTSESRQASDYQKNFVSSAHFQSHWRLWEFVIWSQNGWKWLNFLKRL